MVLRTSAAHLLASILLAGAAAILVFRFWYPSPFDEIAGVGKIFAILLTANIFGPILTAIVCSPKKSRFEMLSDFGIVIAVQLTAFFFGLNVLANARPVALVYEVDRFRLVARPDIYDKELPIAPAWADAWSFSSVRLMGIRLSQSKSELLESLDLSMNGVQTSQRPSRWEPYELNISQAKSNSKEVSLLYKKNPSDKKVKTALAEIGLSEHQVRWLPVSFDKSSDWIVLLDATSFLPVSYLKVSGLEVL